MIKKILWSIVILSLLASFPLIQDRYDAETSTKRVEIVVDYDKVSRLIERSIDGLTEQDALAFLKQVGVTSFAIHEQSIRDYVDLGLVQLYTTNHLNIFEDGETLPPNHSIMLFSRHLSSEEIENYQSMIMQAMPDTASTIVWGEHSAVLFNKPVTSIQNQTIGFDFFKARELRDMGFHLVPRISTSRDWQEQWLAHQFEQLHALDVRTVIFSGTTVLGHPDQQEMQQAVDWFNQYEMNVGAIEFHDQTGMDKFAQQIEKRIIRLFSVSEQGMGDPVNETIETLALAIQERNARLVYLNVPFPSLSQPNTEAEPVLKKVNSLVYGLNQSIKANGYELGLASPFTHPVVKEKGWHNLVIILGALALLSLLAAQFHKHLIYFPIPLGLLAYALARAIDQTVLIHQAFALAAAIAAPALATICIYQWIMKQKQTPKAKVSWSVLLFIISSIISLYGAVVTVSLLNSIDFVKYLDQFRGVKILYFMPMILVGLYLLIGQDTKNIWNRTLTVYNTHIQVKHLIWGGLVLVIAWYYLSRSGNDATVLPYELEFRQLLNDLYGGVRPRTKEVFIGHPLFILATYLILKYKKGGLLLIGGAIGQMSIVSTFTHLHTPLAISLERTISGLVSGAVIGLLLILLWNAGEKVWRKRGRQITHAE